MRKFTSTLVLSLIAMGAFAQVAVPTVQKSADELKQATTTQRILMKCVSQTNENWFTGEVSSASISDKTLFDLEKKDNAYVLKRVSTGNYIQPNEARVQFGDPNTAQKFELVDVPRDQITDGDLRGQVPYVRFRKTDKNIFLNVQSATGTPKYASGTGAWSFVNVYDATDYSLVTLNITKDGATTQVKQVYKKGDKIVPPTYEGYKAYYTETTKLNDDNQTLEVKYYFEISYCESILKTQGKVGYPSDATLYQTLETKIDAVKASATDENNIALGASLNALFNATAVNLPVDGKTYVFTNHHKKADGTVPVYYFTYDTNGLTLVNRGGLTAEQFPAEAKFTCHKLADGKFIFVNNQGKYLVFKGNATTVGTNSNKGFVESYNNTFCPMTIQKHNSGIGKDLFGLVSLGGRRADRANDSFFIIKLQNGTLTFDQTTAFSFFNTNALSTVFQIEEVAYPNNPTLNPIEGNAVAINGAKTIATFSAPFATTLPQGISAFYARQIDVNTVQLEQVTTNVVPANTGVILTSENAQSQNILMIPAAEENVTTIQNNQLGHSAGADKTFAAESFYILGKSGSTVGFFKGKANTTLKMNKAYLKANATSPVMKLIFGGNPGDGTTGIEGVEEQEISVAAPIYDLSGRRVATPIKGGLYIQNGKKIIVK